MNKTLTTVCKCGFHPPRPTDETTNSFQVQVEEVTSASAFLRLSKTKRQYRNAHYALISTIGNDGFNNESIPLSHPSILTCLR